MERIRGFEVAKGFEDKEINLPERKTKYSAGYDIEAAEDVIIPSFKKGINPTLVKTGIKVYMPDDEVVLLYNRSSNPKKKGLIMANSVGVIDKDYYGNPDNDGHIMFAFYNIKEEEKNKAKAKVMLLWAAILLTPATSHKKQNPLPPLHNEILYSETTGYLPVAFLCYRKSKRWKSSSINQ